MCSSDLKRLKEFGVRAFSVHPGAIATELGRHMTEDDRKNLTKEGPRGGPRLVFKSIPQGAATSSWAATTADLDGLGGIYLEGCSIAEPTGAELSKGYVPHAVDPETAEALWTLSETIVNQQFKF